MDIKEEICFNYNFKFNDGREKKFNIIVDKASLQIIRDQKQSYPEWAKLKNFMCSHCPLDESKFEYCPVALNLVEPIFSFSDCSSFEEVEIKVETPNRNYEKRTSLQSGVSAMLGILMVSSGCPYMSRLKPMLHFHLPFASLEETQVRAFSMYLLAQFIKWKKGGRPDWDMNELFNIYDAIRDLNHNVSQKIADLEFRDTNINAVVVLNNFADYVTFALDDKSMDDLEVFLKEFF
jgi:hypothetical protein